ncbi:MAG: YabP/YqfC family sporulation protein [Clostridia bacterium]|nr:YabP/YqfC family sporulation protein [Clostridia bacterium]
MKESLCGRSELPPIELAGNSRILVGACDGILEYEPETVKLRAGKRLVRINGRCLDLCNLSESTVVIRGTVISVEFEG